MQRTDLSKLSALFLFTILILGTASAQTLVVGKIYNADFTGEVAGATVTVTCGSNSLSTPSLADGAYLVRFDTGVCTVLSVTVTATKDSLTGTKSEDNNLCTSGICINSLANVTKYFVVNTGLTTTIPTPNNGGSSGGGSSGYYYYCGNNKCDTGETSATCPKDCPVTTTTAGNTTVTEEKNETKAPSTSFITGAVTGLANFAKSGLGIGLFIVIFIIGGTVIFFSIRKRKKKVATN